MAAEKEKAEIEERRRKKRLLQREAREKAKKEQIELDQ